MWYQYLLVFIGALIFDVTPFPLPPAFTIMIFLQVKFNLSLWPVIFIGVTGSVIGRLILTLYIPKISSKIFNKEKNEDIELLGKKMKDNGWKGQLFVLIYSLMPLPTTPLFVAAGIAKMKPIYIIPVFFVGKFTSDAIAVLTGNYAAKNTHDILKGAGSWQSILSLVGALVLLFGLLFIDWKKVLLEKKFGFKFKIWK